MPLDYDDERIDEAWENYRAVMLVQHPTKAVSKREFVAGFKLGFTAGEQENAAHRDDMSAALRTAVSTSGRLAAKLERIRKITVEDDATAWYVHQDLIRKIIEED